MSWFPGDDQVVIMERIARSLERIALTLESMSGKPTLSEIECSLIADKEKERMKDDGLDERR